MVPLVPVVQEVQGVPVVLEVAAGQVVQVVDRAGQVVDLPAVDLAALLAWARCRLA